MSGFSDMLVYLRKRDGYSQQELAQKIGVSRSTIGMYETGEREPAFETLEALADTFNVNMATLLGQPSGSVCLPKNIVPIGHMPQVPLVGRIACGTPILAEENITDYVDLPGHVRADYALTCIGDSMINAGIRDGDIVYIRQQSVVDNGQIAAVLVGDEEATLKRFYRVGDTVTLNAENPAFPPLVFVGEEVSHVHIIGLAIAYTHVIE